MGTKAGHGRLWRAYLSGASSQCEWVVRPVARWLSLERRLSEQVGLLLGLLLLLVSRPLSLLLLLLLLLLEESLLLLLLLHERLLLERLLLLVLIPKGLQPRRFLLLGHVRSLLLLHHPLVCCLLFKLSLLSSILLLEVRVAASKGRVLRLKSRLLSILEGGVDKWEGIIVLSGRAGKLGTVVEESARVGVLDCLQPAFLLFFG